MNVLIHPAGDPARPARGYLERPSEQGDVPDRIAVVALPFSIGRAHANDLRLAGSAISKHHALLVEHDGACALRDLKSTNGTFVNGTRIDEHVLADGDIIHLGPIELRFRTAESGATGVSDMPADATQALPINHDPGSTRARRALEELLGREAVDIVWQPIVDLASRNVVACEALARGAHPDLPRSPQPLFALAADCGLAVELSRLCRRLALAHGRTLPPDRRLFLNIHPHELRDPGLLPSIETAQQEAGGRRLVLEIPEASVVNIRHMARLARAFERMDLEFAYDDFGAGQSRLRELSDCPPHYLKIDRSIIRGIDVQAPRQAVVHALLSVVGTLGVQVIAEGIEKATCAATCLELGCHLGQGFLFGRPG